MQNTAQRSDVKHRRASALEQDLTSALITPFPFSRISMSEKGRKKARSTPATVLLVVITLTLLYNGLFYRSRHPLQPAISSSSSSSSSQQIFLVTNPPSFIMSSDSISTLTTCHDDNQDVDKGRVWLAGVVRNASADISISRMQTIVDLNCRWNISMHVVAHVGITECRQLYRTLLSRKLAHNDCAPFHVEAEPAHVSEMSNRVDRIAVARDYQREQLRGLYYNNDMATLRRDDLIVVVDLDLHSLPPLDLLVQQIHEMQRVTAHSSSACQQQTPVQEQYDAVCAAGIMYRPYGYYDIFATVLLPDTFVYPIKGRLIRKHAKMENPDLVRSNNLYGNFTQWDLLDYIEMESHKLTKTRTDDLSSVLDEVPQLSAPVPVLSCFGGLTIYRAIQWFDSRCRYSHLPVNNTAPNWLSRYASKSTQRPCEHVVFHKCLHKTLSSDKNSSLSFSIAIQPAMRTEWNRHISFGHALRPGSRHEALGIFQKHADRADRLTNGKHTLRIHETGTLRVERWGSNTLQKKPETKWSASLQYAKHVNYWTHMYLILKPSGELQLIKQVPLSLLNQSKTLCQSKKDPCVCSVDNDNCSIVVWSVSGQEKNNTFAGKTLSPVLVLDSHGHVSIIDENQHNKVLWTNGKQQSINISLEQR
jgi:hypothetical protein